MIEQIRVSQECSCFPTLMFLRRNKNGRFSILKLWRTSSGEVCYMEAHKH